MEDQFALILLDTEGKPFRIIGPFEFEDSPKEWMTENIGSREIAHVVLPLEISGEVHSHFCSVCGELSYMKDHDACSYCVKISRFLGLDLTDWQVTHNPKPIPSRKHDWDWCHKDYDGPGDKRCGSAASKAMAFAEIKTLLEEEQC